MDNLTDSWNAAKKSILPPQQSAQQLLHAARKGNRSILRFHSWNIAILMVTLAGIIAFFVKVAPVRETISRTGAGLMIGGLIIRIIVEVTSLLQYKKIHFGDTALDATDKAIRFYNFRKRIHGPVTLTILLAYFIGAFLLLPEFSIHISTPVLTLMYSGFVLSAFIFGWQIKKSMKKELDNISLLGKIRTGFTEPENDNH